MSYEVVWSRRSERQLDKLDPTVARALVKFMNERVHRNTDPRGLGKQLRDSQHWRYRVGDYRILRLIRDDGQLVVLVVELGHRREIYR